MTYHDAKSVLRDGAWPADGQDFTSRLLASPGKMSAIDTSTAGELPEGDSYADEILRSLLVVRRHIVDQSTVERDLMGMLIELAAPIRVLASESRRHADTRIPQISLILDAICMSSAFMSLGPT